MDHLIEVDRSSESEHGERQAIESLCRGRPDVVSILSGSIVKRSLRNGAERYSTGSYTDLDVAGLLSGGKARVIAAAEIACFYPDVPILANGNTYENAPPDARIITQELRGFGASSNPILLQENSYSTFTELIELVKFVAEHKWDRVVIITNEFQIPRAQEFLRQIDVLHDPHGVSKQRDFRAALPIFLELAPEVVFVSAEAVLPLRNSRYRPIVDQAKASPAWKERTARDAQGLKQLREGTYWNNVKPGKKRAFRL